jgi:acyl transferase domain-containing protein
MACRFPKAQNQKSFWKILRDSVDTIAEVPSARWDVDAFYDPTPDTPGKMITRWGGFVDGVDQFDPSFFGLSLREAQRMDPQQRLVLEVAWEALEDAGLVPAKLAGNQTGVFIGISHSDHNRILYRDLSGIDAYNGPDTYLCIAANRLSYLLNLQGPSMAIDTACSSSLVAVHLACQSLRSGESQVAIVGGVNLNLSPEEFIALSLLRVLSTGTRCKTFDSEADGYVRGEGCGVIVLKRLSDTLKDGDNILSIIKGSAVNHNGLSNGLTAPNGAAQQLVIRRALENAGVSPSDISYVETHGTATVLGDLIEVKSLKAVLMQNRTPNQPCLLGSVKPNIGHLEAAAGIASLIKVVLSLQHGELPPQLHFNQLHPYISLEGTTFSIPTEPQPWPAGFDRRVAGVSAFGFGGTNAHVVLEGFPVQRPTLCEVEHPLHLLTLSAKSEPALQELASRYQEFLVNHPTVLLADVCFTANTGRSQFDYRLAVVTDSTVQLSEQLGAFVAGKETVELVNGKVTRRKRPPVEVVLPSLNHEREKWQATLQSLGEAYVRGGAIDWSTFYRDYPRRRLQLPTYPFQRQRCCLETAENEFEKV